MRFKFHSIYLITSLLVIFMVSFSDISAQKLTRAKYADGKIKVKVPADFYPMTPEDIAQRFPSVRRQIAALTGPQRVMGFTIAVSATQWLKDDYVIAKDFFKSSIINLFDKVEMIDEGIREIKKNKFAYFEFISLTAGTDTKGAERRYNYQSYFIAKGKTIVFTFSTPYQFQEDWQNAADEIMRSIKISPNI